MGVVETISNKNCYAIRRDILIGVVSLYNLWKKRSSGSADDFLDEMGNRKGARAKRKSVLWLLEDRGRAKKLINEVERFYLINNPDEIPTKKKTYRLNYETYLKSPGWKKRREELIKSVGKCVLCGVKGGLLAHHLHYRTLGSEQNGDVAIMCNECHTYMHNKYGRGAKFGLEEIGAEKERRQKDRKIIGERAEEYLLYMRGGNSVLIGKEIKASVETAILNGDVLFTSENLTVVLSEVLYIINAKNESNSIW